PNSRQLLAKGMLLRQVLYQKPLMRSRLFPWEIPNRPMANDPKELSGPTTLGPDGNILVPPVTLKVIPVSPPTNLDYEDRNMMLGRELSPHLTIYKLQLTSLLSICLRISGFVLGVFVWVLGISGLFLQGDMEGFVQKVEKCDCSHTLLTAGKVMVAVPFAYHMVAGTRHLIWYLNKFTTIKEVYATGYAAIGVTLALIVGLLNINVAEKVKEEVVDLTKDKKKAKAPKAPKKEAKKQDKGKKNEKAKADPKKDSKDKSKKEDEGKKSK
ncbi:hypothetical protein KR009_009535, partial [Drosophila setifemur]